MLTGYGIRDLDQFTNFFMTDISRLQRCLADVEKQKGKNLISLWQSTALATAAFGNPHSQLPHSRALFLHVLWSQHIKITYWKSYCFRQ